jgi:recombination protein RecA
MTRVSELHSKLGTINLEDKINELVKFRVPTGILAIDRVVGGGIPAGKLTEIYGDFSTGKSRIACHVIAETQRLGGRAILIDTERALDQGLVDLTGVSLKGDSFFYPNPDTELRSIEDVFRIVETGMKLLREDDPDKLLTIVWDSVAATPGLEDIEKEIGRNEASMRRAKVISDGLKKIMAQVYQSKTCLIFINQIRDKIGVLYGEKVDTVGGRMIKFTASLRIHCFLSGAIRNEETKEIEGYKGRIEVTKSRVCRPFGVVNFEMRTDEPIDKYSGLLDYMVRHGEVISTAGWYAFPGSTKKFRLVDFPQEYEEYVKTL